MEDNMQQRIRHHGALTVLLKVTYVYREMHMLLPSLLLPKDLCIQGDAHVVAIILWLS